MDKASQVLAQGPPVGVPRSYRAIADHSGVPHSTLYHRAHGRRSIEEKAESQRYLTPFEEKAVVDFILQMAELGTPVRIKYIPSIAFSSTRHRPLPDRPLKPPGKNWVKALEKRRPELVARRVKAMDWNRHDKNTYQKIEHWFLSSSRSAVITATRSARSASTGTPSNAGRRDRTPSSRASTRSARA